MKMLAPSMKKGRRSGKNTSRSRQVDHRRVDLDLAEVGVHRGVEGEVAADAHLQVGAHARAWCPSPARKGSPASPGLSRRKLA